MATFGEYARIYDLLYRDKDYAGEAQFIDRILRREAPAGKTILELGTGTALHARELAGKGWRIDGVERSAGMLEAARARAGDHPAIRLHPGDARTFEAGTRFDAVISLFHVVSYLNEDADVQAFLATAAKHLSPGGVLFFDFWYGPAVVAQKPEVRVKRVQGDGLEVIRLAEPTHLEDRHLIELGYTIFHRPEGAPKLDMLTETHHMRYFFEPEIRTWVRDAGFEVTEFAEWMTSAQPSVQSWGVHCVARKR
jgi:SAM-dependent methyltransferase